MPAALLRKPRLIFINRFYRPDETATAQLLTDLAENLAALGHDVIVITSHGGGATPRMEILNGVSVRRVFGLRGSSRGLLSKLGEFATFYFVGLFRLVRLARHDDIVIALTDPPLIGIGAWICARLRGAKIVHWVQDIYPELGIELAGQSWLRSVRPLRNAAWRAAEHCVTLGNDMAAVLAASGIAKEKIAIVPNWAPAGINFLPREAVDELRRAWDLSRKFVVEYSGNLGRVHDLAPVMEVAHRLREIPEIVFLFIGSGAQHQALQQKAAVRGLTNVMFRPPQPRAQLAETLALADIHLVTLKSGCAHWVFPSKLYGITAVGRPLLFLGPTQCDVAQLVERGGFGRAFASSDSARIADTIEALKNNRSECERMSLAALAFAGRNGGARAAAQRWSGLLTPAGELAATRAGG